MVPSQKQFTAVLQLCARIKYAESSNSASSYLWISKRPSRQAIRCSSIERNQWQKSTNKYKLDKIGQNGRLGLV